MPRRATRNRVVEEARKWLGTPYHHQESLIGRGCDCLGLLRGVWRGVYQAPEPEQPPNYSPSWSDHRMDDPLLRIAKEYFTEVPKGDMKKGDVLFFRMRRSVAVKHCSIYVGDGMMIHAYSGHQVREEHLTDWWKAKMVGVFKFKGVR